MEVLTAGLTPLLLHKRAAEPKRLLPLKLSKLSCTPEIQFLPRRLTASLTLLSSLLAVNGPAGALSYEEALQLSPGGLTDIDISGILNDIISFASENALVIGGGAVALAVPVVLAQVLKSSKPWGVESAKSAYAKLSESADAQLLDIREGRDIKEVGRPDVRSLKKKAVAITFTRDNKLGFLKKLAVKFKDPRNTTLFILDKFDGNSELVAELVTANGFKAAYGIKDGAEGARGWMNSGLPWSGPKKTLDIDFGDLKDAISLAFGGESSNGLPLALGLAAATGLGLFTFTEIETVLQLLGSAALLQLVTKKLLYAEDRKATLQQVDEFVNTKVAPKELVDELKMIGKALLPAPINKRASLPAATVSVEKVDAAAETKSETKVEAAADPPPEINSVPKAEFSQESVPVAPRPLSPYPAYPDFKPPSSPSPSQP